MGDHHGGDAQFALQILDFVAQVNPHLGVQRRQRFIQQQQTGIGGNRTRQRDALLLAAGQLGGVFAALFGQADQFQQLGHTGLDFGFAAAGILQTERNVLFNRQVGEQRVGLEHNAKIPHRRGQVRHVLAVLNNSAACLQVKPGNGAQQGGFATARRAKETNKFALVDVQRDVFQRQKIAKGFPQVSNAQIHVVCRFCHGAVLG